MSWESLIPMVINMLGQQGGQTGQAGQQRQKKSPELANYQMMNNPLFGDSWINEMMRERQMRNMLGQNRM